MLGFRPVVVSDACCSKNEDYHASALSALAHGFAEVCTTRDIIHQGYSRCSTS
jgi:isochorismate hydrolase